MSKVVYEHALGCSASVISDAGAASDFQRSVSREKFHVEQTTESGRFVMPTKQDIMKFVDAMFEASGQDEINLRILRLHYKNQLNSREISAIVGISSVAVRIRLHRMRESAKAMVS